MRAHPGSHTIVSPGTHSVDFEVVAHYLYTGEIDLRYIQYYSNQERPWRLGKLYVLVDHLQLEDTYTPIADTMMRQALVTYELDFLHAVCMVYNRKAANPEFRQSFRENAAYLFFRLLGVLAYSMITWKM